MTPIKDILQDFPSLITIVEESRVRQIRRESFWRNNEPSKLTALDRAEVEAATVRERFDKTHFERVQISRVIALYGFRGVLNSDKEYAGKVDRAKAVRNLFVCLYLIALVWLIAG